MRNALLVLSIAVGPVLAQQPPPATTPSPANATDPTPAPVPAPAPTTAPAGAAAPAPVAAVREADGETVLSPRIRSITKLHNSMPHQLVGVGLVTGLAKTGSSDRGTRQAILNLVRQLGLNLTIADVVGGSTALVSLTCALPPFARAGQQLDVKVQVIGDAESLRGGELIRTELKGVDGQTYVVAQGALLVSGISASGTTASAQKNTIASAWLDNGGIVVREENTSFFSESGSLELQVLNPTPFNASSIAAGARTALDGTSALVSAVDQGLIRIDLPDADRTNENAMRILNLVGNVRVPVENPVKVLVDQTTGTVLAGEGVLISPCIVGVTDFTIAIVDEEDVSQPNPLGQGTTERVGRTRVEIQQTNSPLNKLGGGATVADLLQNLRALDIKPDQLVRVFQALDQGGFLHATLEVR